MYLLRMLKKPNVLVNLLLPVIFGIGLLYYYQQHIRSAADIGLGKGTSAYFPIVNNFPIHISDPAFADSIMKGWKERGTKPLYLWQGNSQLHGVNQYKVGHANCIEFLFNSLKKNNEEVIGVSYANGNLQEFLASLIYFSHKFPLKAIIQPAFYDDMREDGIRTEINIPEVINAIKSNSTYFRDIPNITSLKINDTTGSNISNDDFNGIHATVQEMSERFLDKELENSWSIWKSRPDLRGNLFNDLYKLRNMALGIKANTVRKMIPGRYADNYKAFLDMIAFCNGHHIPLIIYIPPLRNDVSPPYDLNEYSKFKEQVKLDCEKHQITFINLENLVPAKYWGTKEGTSFGASTELDFMHFQQTGHQLIADTIYNTLSKLFSK